MYEDYEQYKPEVKLSQEQLHELIKNNDSINKNIKKFKNWMELKYKAAEIYDTLEAQHVWEDVMGKFNELFE